MPRTVDSSYNYLAGLFGNNKINETNNQLVMPYGENIGKDVNNFKNTITILKDYSPNNYVINEIVGPEDN